MTGLSNCPLPDPLNPINPDYCISGLLNIRWSASCVYASRAFHRSGVFQINGFWKQDIVFKMYMNVQIILKVLQEFK